MIKLEIAVLINTTLVLLLNKLNLDRSSLGNAPSSRSLCTNDYPTLSSTLLLL